ncbi:hypothetical protein P7C73_g6503, partial [Tremellales sp. Uapishka_1]
MRPAPELVFEGREPEGYIGGHDLVKQDDFGDGLPLEDFFRLPWVNHPGTVPELLFIRRTAPTSSTAHKSGSRWSSHIAFPGGRHSSEDKSALFTALRETWEEIGIDLAEKEFLEVGRLDEREITTSLGKRLLMILSPFVFLQTSPFTPQPELQASEVSSVHWIPLSSLTPPFSATQWSHIEIDISTRLSPRNKLARWALRRLVGKMQFGCVLLPDEPDYVAEGFDVNDEFEDPPEGGSGSWWNHDEGKRMLRLWGLTLGMSLDLLAHLPSPSPPSLILHSRSSSPHALGPRTPVTVTSSFDDQWDTGKDALVNRSRSASTTTSPSKAPMQNIQVLGGSSGAGLSRTGSLGMKSRRRGVGPGLTSVFPRFSYPDVNFWIWVFGRKYRKVVRGWEASVSGPDRASYRRTNWSGAALSTFYSAVRQALVVAIIIRGLATGLTIAGLSWWAYKRFGGLPGAAARGEL